MYVITLDNIYKTFRNYDCRNQWLRQELIDIIKCKRHQIDRWTVLSDINIKIGRGECVAILGRNGSGKSTLLKLIAGILKPNSGVITHKGSICTLFDIGAGFHEELTGRENVYVDGAILGLSEKYLNAILPDIESFAELQGFMDTPLRYYSSGMKARLGFAVAMSTDPDIFLIDEVLAVGDEGFKRKCLSRLDELVSKGRTIVIVSHDTESVRRFCTRGIWLHNGKIRMDGDIEDTCDEYLRYFDTSEEVVNTAEGAF